MNWIKKIQTTIIASFFVFISLYCAVDVRAENLVSVEERFEINQVLNDLFAALKSGDVGSLKRLFAEEMYAKNKILLEKNAGYSDFLRNYYRETIFKVTEISPDNDGLMASFIALFPDGSKKTTHLLLAQRALETQQKHTVPNLLEARSKGWFIIKQINGK